ncbi:MULTISPECIES: MoxR family ATPase [unclassified Dehalobacter]|uniref:AAA family ATPase n=1 Tax=unclassified Dehalobacter TaxID=2635733 RepID=UPI000E6C6E46|nr:MULTISPECIES: MoxR family ATPase [unclassified Dehalobacter]RJE46900.1 ATPase [Dehalobacter sp. MCB1]TCX50823.1 ATPase [Dehalobacter sp. 12DCB1]TCX51534.1 ATPase [Dehalobacter sp. 14DCB1]
MNLEEIKEGLQKQGYIANDNTAMILHYSLLLNKPLLIEGPTGAGKTELAKAWSQYLNRELIRLQCYEGIDEGKALYEWDYQKQLLYIQTKSPGTNEWSATSENIYTDEFLLKRPLLKAIASDMPSVLLIDEIDKSDEEFESFLLEILSDWQISIPEIGTIPAVSIPSVLLTSNSTRNLSQALRRRCLYLHVDYPNEQRELEILQIHFPDLLEHLGKQAVTFIRKLRLEKLKKHPSISEVIDWVNILEQLQVEELTAEVASSTLNILFKYQDDCRHVLEKVNQKDWFDGILHS